MHGLTMEREYAKKMGLVGKCRGCVFLDCGTNKQGDWVEYCLRKEKILKEHEEDCEDWFVDIR